MSAINSLEPKEVYKKELQKLVYDFSFRNFNKKQSNILNLEELASIYHFPTHYIETPYIKAAKSAATPPPTDLSESGEVCVGKVSFRNEEKKVYFASRQDRRRHFYIIGQTGVGKSWFMKGMIAQDIANGDGVAVVDPHGELVEDVLAIITVFSAKLYGSRSHKNKKIIDDTKKLFSKAGDIIDDIEVE